MKAVKYCYCLHFCWNSRLHPDPEKDETKKTRNKSAEKLERESGERGGKGGEYQYNYKTRSMTQVSRGKIYRGSRSPGTSSGTGNIQNILSHRKIKRETRL